MVRMFFVGAMLALPDFGRSNLRPYGARLKKIERKINPVRPSDPSLHVLEDAFLL
jgi:hypothetical protein